MSATLQMQRPKGSDKRVITVATVCMNAKLDKEANIETFVNYMSEASRKGAQLIVFPEISLQQNLGWGRSSHQPTDKELAYVHESAESIPGPSTEKLVDAAKRFGIFVVFGMTEKSLDGMLYNSSVFLGPDGVIGRYRKKRLWDSDTGGNEHLFWKCGTEGGVFESPLGKVGLMICVEMHFNFGLALAEEGADFLVTISAWPSFGADGFEEATKNNAVEANLWHIVSNQVGVVGHATDYGHSRIVSPNGDIIEDTGAEEGMVIATISI